MTKYMMVKKLAKETGLTQKDARKYLRNVDWDYGKAYEMWSAIHAIESINWDDICKVIADGIKRIAECMQKFIDEGLPKLAENIKMMDLGLDGGDENGAAGCAGDCPESED